MFQSLMNIISLWALPAIIIIILTTGLLKKVPLYETFTDGAKDGFHTVIQIMPTLIGLMIGVGILRALRYQCLELRE